MHNREKRQWAQLLYLRENLTLQEIATKVGVNRITVGRWAKEDKWDELKANYTITREQQLQRLYQQIAEINRVISQRENKHPTTQEADIISKLATAIDKLERESSLADIISVSMRFLSWLRPQNPEKATELAEYFDAYIKHTISQQK